MAKLKTPLLSLNARGGLGRVLSFVRRRGQNIVEKKPIPADAKSLSQLSWRHMYQKCTILWHALSVAEKLAWESSARSRHMTGYAWFISQCLKPNPGIYLPLQGGTMAGDIDMAKHKIIRLPAPVNPQDAARLADVGGVTTFLALTDTPANYAGDALKVARVNAGENALEFATPAVGAQLFIAETEVFNGNSPIAWTDLDLSGTIGAQATQVMLKVKLPHATRRVGFRKNGDTDSFDCIGTGSRGCAFIVGDTTKHMVVLVNTDSSGKIEWKASAAVAGTTLDVMAYIK